MKKLHKNKRMFILIATLIVTILFTYSISGSHISKYFMVKDRILYRSAQPDLVDFLFFKNTGIKSVINFREGKSDNQWMLLNLIGFDNYLHLKVKDYNPPTEKQIAAFLNFVSDKRNQPVLMHCRSGKGRAGTFEVLYHYFVEGKTMEEAIKITTLSSKLSDQQYAWLLTYENNNKPNWDEQKNS